MISSYPVNNLTYVVGQSLSANFSAPPVAGAGSGSSTGGAATVNSPAIQVAAVSGGYGAGGCIDAIIPSPASSYAVVIGPGGGGGTGFAPGAAGGSGFVIVEEFYQ